MSEEMNANETAVQETAVVQKKQTAVSAEKTNWARMHGSWKERIERMLPDPKMIDQFICAAETQYGKNKQGFESCTPISFMNCLLTSAKYGILPDGRNAHLIPYGSECTLQFDYKGLVHVVIRDGIAKKVYAETVCANDKFVYRNGKVELHEITFPRGKVLGVYVEITLCNGEKQYEIMDVDDIERIKAGSKGSKSPSSPWNTYYGEMAKKAVFKRSTKWLKLSPDVMDAIAADNEGFDFNALPRRSEQNGGGIFKMPETAAQISMYNSAKQTVEVPTMEQKAVAEAETKRKAEGGKNLPF